MIDFWSLWGVLGSLLGGLGGVLGGLWRLLRHLGRLLGGLEAVLDRSWAALIGHGSLRVILESTRPADVVKVEGPRGAKMRPKWAPRRTKIDVKNEDEKKSSSRSSWSRLGPILGRSDRQNRAVAPVALDFLKNHVFQQMRRQEAIWNRTWVDLRGQEAPKWRPRRVPYTS